MHKILKFVQGSVSKKDFIPVLKHFVIEDGTVRGFNGLLALCAPIPLSISCKPRADQLVDAVANCSDDVSMALTTAGKLRIKSGSYATSVDCTPDEETPHARPEGEHYAIDGEAFLKALEAVAPFIGDDASRPWTNGVLFAGASAYATNNVIAVEYYMGTVTLPGVIVIQRPAVKELLRIGEPPTEIQVASNSVSFHYGDGRWLFTLLGDSDKWPNIPGMLDKLEGNAPTPIDPELYTGVELIKKRVDKIGRVYMGNGRLSTLPLTEIDGTEYALPWMQHEGIYNVDMVLSLKDVVTHMDWTCWPAPAKFYGADGKMRGAIAGLRL